MWGLGLTETQRPNAMAANAQNNPDQALIYLQESFEILQRIGSPDAAKVQNLIDKVKTQDA